MKRRIVSLFCSMCIIASIVSPVAVATGEQETADFFDDSMYYIQQVDGEYRFTDLKFRAPSSESVEDGTTVPVRLNSTGIIYESNDNRYFYAVGDGTLRETSKVEIPVECKLSAEDTFG